MLPRLTPLCAIHKQPTAMSSAALQVVRRKSKPTDNAIDPYELFRRLSAVQAEETIKELERKRISWETALLESRNEQHGRDEGRTVARSAASAQPYKGHRRAASVSLSPHQLSPPPYTDLSSRQRQQYLPPQYTAASRRPSMKRGDSELDLETINEDTAAEPSLARLFPEWSQTIKDRRRSSLLRSVSEDGASDIISTPPMSRKRLSVLSPREPGQRDCSPSDGLSKASRQSAPIAQRRHSRQDWSRSDESPRWRSHKRSSLVDKIGEYLTIQHADQNSDAGDIDVFDSRASTLRNSWKSSVSGSTSSRRASVLKKVGELSAVRPPKSDDGSDIQNMHVGEEYSVVKKTAARKVSAFFSKLRL